MSHCWMWSKLNCFITGVVNWEMSKKQRKLYPIFYIMFKRIKRGRCLKEKKKVFPTMFHKILMENTTV